MKCISPGATSKGTTRILGPKTLYILTYKDVKGYNYISKYTIIYYNYIVLVMSFKGINFKRYLQHITFIQMRLVKICSLSVQSNHQWSFRDCSKLQWTSPELLIMCFRKPDGHVTMIAFWVLGNQFAFAESCRM